MNPRIRLAHRIAVDGCDNGFELDDSFTLPDGEGHRKMFAKLANDAMSAVVQKTLHTLDVTNVMRHAPEYITTASCPYCMPPFAWTMCEMRQSNGGQLGIISFCSDIRKDAGVVMIFHMWVFFDRSSRRPWIAPIGLLQRLDKTCCPLGDGVAFVSPTMRKFRDSHDYLFCPSIPSFVFSLLSCKNVITVDLPSSELPETKWSRRQGEKIKGLIFKTLQIDGFGSSGPRAESGEPSGAHNRFHICRGSFAEYTAERPLFGKYTGRFWRPAHVKGSKEVGEVVKDYEVGPRAGVPANADS